MFPFSGVGFGGNYTDAVHVIDVWPWAACNYFPARFPPIYNLFSSYHDNKLGYISFTFPKTSASPKAWWYLQYFFSQYLE